MAVSEQPTRPPDSASRPRKALTIGAVCKILQSEFDDISISKIRYLEDQKLLTPAPHRRRLPPLQPGRRRTAADDPAPAARRVPAAAGDPPGARRRRRHRSSAARERKPAGGAVRRAILVNTSQRLPDPRGGGRGDRRPRGADRRAGELRHRPAREARGQDRLRRDRPRDRPRRQRALPVRRRRPQPARLPLLGRPRGATCWKRCWGPRCARATPSAARRRWRAWRAWRRPSATSSTCCWSATCAAWPATDGRRADAAGHPPAHDRGARRARSGSWSPTPTACRAGGRGRRGSRTSSARAAAGAASGPRCWRPREGAACGPTSAASARPRASATSGSSSSRARRSRATCAARGSRSACAREGGGTEVEPHLRADAARDVAARLADDAPRPGRDPRRGAGRDRAGADRRRDDRRCEARRGATRSGGGGATRRSRRSSTRAALAVLRERIGELEPWPLARELEDFELPPARAAAAGAGRGGRRRARLRRRPRTALRHATGRGYVDLARLRSGRLERAPDAVVLPARRRRGAARARGLRRRGRRGRPLRRRHQRGRRGRAAARRPRAADQPRPRRALREVEVDRRSLTARLGAGLRGPEAEAALGAAGPRRSATSRSPSSTRRSAASPRPARPARPRAATGASTRWSARCACSRPAGRAAHAGDPAHGRRPGAARAGRRLRGRARRDPRRHRAGAPGAARCAATRPGSRRASRPGPEIVRALAQGPGLPDVIRVSDEEETRGLAGALGPARRSPAALFDGYLGLRRRRGGCADRSSATRASEESVARRRALAVRALRAGGAAYLGQAAGRSWEHGRYQGPYLRDTLMDMGAMVETLETSHTWTPPRRAARARSAARSATRSPARARPGLVFCHLSHAYADGASLYFTFIARARHGAELEQWRAVKRAASRGDRRRRRHDHPPPRGRPRPRSLHGGRGRGDRPRGAARGQGAARPGRDHEPRQAARLTPEVYSPASAARRRRRSGR